ncbi:MAG: hypothetical protein EPGJADBJ_04455 [Saprospiraceae bacterium]|nr:hypothetical protein [Saprospiraceae bacterium]
MANTIQILIGLMLIHKYEPASPVSLGRNCIICGSTDAIEQMTTKEYDLMIENGWDIDPANECWTHKA